MQAIGFSGYFRTADHCMGWDEQRCVPKEAKRLLTFSGYVSSGVWLLGELLITYYLVIFIGEGQWVGHGTSHGPGQRLYFWDLLLLHASSRSSSAPHSALISGISLPLYLFCLSSKSFSVHFPHFLPLPSIAGVSLHLFFRWIYSPRRLKPLK